MNYKDCYFMHIPKTGGRYFRHNILSPLGLPSEFDKDFKKKFLTGKEDESDLVENKSPHNGNSHVGWSEYIKENTYIISTWRDPAKRCLSEYAFGHKNPSLDDFFKNLESLNNSEGVRSRFAINSQSKAHYQTYQDTFSISSTIIDLSPKDPELFNDFFYKQIERVNFRIRIQDVSANRIKIMKYLKSQFPIEQSFELGEEVPYVEWVNPNSEKLWNQLTESDKDYIYKSNYLDLEVWNNDKYFWSPND